MHIEPAQLKKAVFTAISHTFEAMIFTPVAPIEVTDISSLFPASSASDTQNHDPITGEAESCPPGFYQTEISLENPQKVLFSMIFPSNLAISITKNLYGWMEENDPPENLIQDSLAEIINTVAGKLMTIVLDDQSTFTLSLPILKSVNSILMEKGDIYPFQTVDNDNFLFIIN